MLLADGATGTNYQDMGIEPGVAPEEWVFDAPERLDLNRGDNPHISFSAGIHYCIGAPLARIELAASMRALLEQAPTLRLAAEPDRKPNFVIRGLNGLSVELG